MNDLRTAAQQALEALTNCNSEHGHRCNRCDSEVDEGGKVVATLRAALAQQDEPVQEPDAYGYASRLAIHIWQKHYKEVSPQWKPLDDLMGVLTQIDNMTSGLTLLAQQAEPVQEPVAYIHRQGNYWDTSERHLTDDEKARGWTEEPLYTTPPQRLPLTEEEIDKIFKHLCNTVGASYKTMARATERAHGIKE